MKTFTIQKLIYAQMSVNAKSEEEAISIAKTEPNTAWNICEFDASEDYSVVDEDEI